MSYKLGLILSMGLVVAFFLLGGDMLCLSSAFANLDSTSVTIAYAISKTGRVDTEFLTTLESTYNIKFLELSPSNPKKGDIVDFVISSEYDPLIMSNSVLTLKASRSAVIGYYG